MNTFNDSNPIQQWFALSLRDENSPKNKKIYSSTNERIDLFSNTEKITKSLSTSNPSDNEAVSICQTIFKEIEEYSSEKFDIPVKWAARYTRHGESTKNAYVGAYEIFHRLFQKIEERKDLYDTNDPHVKNALSKMKEIDREILKCVNEPENELPTQGNELPTRGLANVSPQVRHAIFSNLLEIKRRDFSEESFKTLIALSKTSKEVRNLVKAELVYLFNQGKIAPQYIDVKSLKILDQFLGAEYKKKLERLDWSDLSEEDIEGFDWKSYSNLKEVRLYHPKNLSCLKDIGEKLEKLELQGLDEQDLEPLKNCVNIKYLDLSYAKIKNLSFLTSIGKNLKTLILKGCKKFDDLEVFKYCTELIDLDLSNGKVKDLSFLEGLKKLRKLNLEGCELNNFSALKKCMYLRDLNLSSSNVKDLNDLKASDENLQILDLSNCKQLTDFSPLKNYVNLKKLNLSYSSIEDLSFLAGCGKTLQELNLGYCENLKDGTPIEFCTDLKRLVLDYTKINDLNFLKNIRETLSSLQMLFCNIKNGDHPGNYLPEDRFIFSENK